MSTVATPEALSIAPGDLAPTTEAMTGIAPRIAATPTNMAAADGANTAAIHAIDKRMIPAARTSRGTGCDLESM